MSKFTSVLNLWPHSSWPGTLDHLAISLVNNRYTKIGKISENLLLILGLAYLPLPLCYHENMVAITTTTNLIQDEILTHLVFDTGNSTKTCNEQIEVRLQNMKKAHYKPPPVQWSNIEYVMPMAILFLIVLTISITVNFMYCCRRQENSGPRRNNNFELVNTN